MLQGALFFGCPSPGTATFREGARGRRGVGRARLRPRLGRRNEEAQPRITCRRRAAREWPAARSWLGGDRRRSPRRRCGAEQSRAAEIKMTTAVPVGHDDSLLQSNVTTKSQEQILYQSSGAIVAAIVVGVIVIFTVVLLLLKMYNRRMRTQRELEPKNAKAAIPSALDHSSHSAGQIAPATSTPVNIHLQHRKP